MTARGEDVNEAVERLSPIWPARPTIADVFGVLPVGEALNVMEVARLVCGREDAWRKRGTVRDRLYRLCSMGAVVSDDHWPMRFTRKAPA